MRSGFGGFRRELDDNDRSARRYGAGLGIVDKQLRALGTTIRYTVAGGAIFGGFTAVRNLSQIQQQLGLISAISPTAFNNVALAGQALTDFGEQAEDAAFRALTPISEFNQGLVNLVSTVQNVPQDQVVPMLQEIAQTAKLSLTPVDEATKGITGMLVAFDKQANLSNVRRFLAEYQRLIFTVPGGAAAGPQIIQQLPQLAAVSRLSAVDPEQMFGLLNTVLRAGGSPSTGARGLQYLIQGLAQPPSKEAAAALRGIGITPEFTQREGGVAALLKLVQEVRRRGVTGNVAGLRTMSPEILDQLEGTAGPDVERGLGISGAGSVFARQAVGRIHGVRSLILLASQGDQMLDDLRAMAELGNSQAEQTDQLRSAWQRYADRAKLQEVSTAIDQMSVDIAQVFEPLLNFGGQGIIQLRNLIDAHPELTVGAGLAAAGGLAARRGLRGIGGGALRTVGAANAITAIGNEGLGASPTNPMFVAIVYSLAGGGPGGKGKSIIEKAEDVTTKGAAGGFFARTLGKIGVGRLGLGVLGATAGALGGAVAATDYVMGRDYSIPIPKGLRKLGLGKDLNFTTPPSAFSLDPREHEVAPWLRNLFKHSSEYNAQARAFEKRFGLAGDDRRTQPGMKFKGEIDLTINTPEGKKQRTVPMTLTPDFSPFAPQTRGQDKTYRGG